MNRDDDNWQYSPAFLRNRDAGAERIRADTIVALGKAHGRRDLADRAVTLGVPVRNFQLQLMQELANPVRPLGSIGMSRTEIEQWSLCRWMLDPENVGLEVECSRACAKAAGIDDPSQGQMFVPLEILTRALNVGAAYAGGFTVQTNVLTFIDALRGASVTNRLGATRLTGLRGNSTVPRIASSTTSGWLASETSAPPESELTLDQLAMTPKTVSALVELSRKIVAQANPSVESVVMSDLGGLFAQAVDIGAIAGSGASGEPLGILNTAGIGAFTGASLDLAALTNAQVDVCTAGAAIRGDALGYATTPAVAALLKARQRFTDSSTALWEGSVYEGIVEGTRAMSSTNVPTATAIFADWSQLLIGEWGVLEIRTNPYQNFRAGIIAISAHWSVDVGLRHRASFSVASGIS
jgi:HK97 family phage major capsid protein